MTIRTLVILRHAKAARIDGLPDRDRPLTPRGHADAGAAGAWLLRSGYLLDLVLCSPARRTRETWDDMALVLPAGALPAGLQIRYDDELYASGPYDLLKLVARLADDVSTVLLVGHNPAVSELSALLDPAHAVEEGLRTCGFAVHAVEGAWKACRRQGAELSAVHTARG